MIMQMKHKKLTLSSLFLFFIPFLFLVGSVNATKVLVVEVEGPITQATTELIRDSLNEKADIIILTLDTTGGELTATFEIMGLIENSEIPFVGYVYPKGAKAWSAGTFILLSTHIAAMSPFTVIGSSQPVAMGLSGSQTINDSKIINALVALMKERMRMHNRNISIVGKFIEENLNLNDVEAQEANVIEISANDIDDLLKKIDGRKVNTAKGKILLNTKNAEVITYSPSFRISFMKIITDPIIASILLMVGIYALIFGLSNPGIGSELLGVLFILLGIIGIGFDVNIAGLILILIGIGLILFELTTPGFGVLGITGVAALTLGVILMGPLTSPNWYISKEFQKTLLYSIVIPSVIFGIFLIFALFKVAEIKFKKPVIGGKMVGKKAKAVDDITERKEGYVRYEGELWKAKVKEKNMEIKKGIKVKIVGRDEVEDDLLIIEPL